MRVMSHRCKYLEGRMRNLLFLSVVLTSRDVHRSLDSPVLIPLLLPVVSSPRGRRVYDDREIYRQAEVLGT